MNTNNPTENQLNIEISEEVAEGTYANLAIITHSHAEFVVDFVNVMPGTPKSRVKNRIILTPFHAKRFMKAMIDNITQAAIENSADNSTWLFVVITILFIKIRTIKLT